MRETGTARRSERCPWEGHRRAPPPSHCVAARSPSAASGRSNHFIRTMDGRMVWSSGHLERESRVTVAAHLPVRKHRLGTKVPADMYQGVGACTALVQCDRNR